MRDWLLNLPIPKKLWLFNLLTAVIAGIFAAALLILVVWRIEYAAAEREIAIKAAIVAENALPSLQFGDERSAREILAGFARDGSVVSARIVTPGGRSFAAYEAVLSPGTAPAAGMITARTPIENRGERLGVLEVTYETSEVRRQIVSYLAAVGIATMAALLVGSFFVMRLQRTITSPLGQLTQLMREVTEGPDFSRRAKVPGRDEIGELSLSFNRMIDAIASREQALNVELTERRRAERQLEHLAHHDPVTGLPNRHYFRRRSAELGVVAADASVALLFVDLDNFKYVNDTFGHDMGDQLLVAVAGRLTQAVRANDLVVRFGGDEFVILLDRVAGTEAAMKLARKVGTLLTERLNLDGQEFTVTCSIGVAVAPEHGKLLDDLLAKADAAMYVAKAEGKNAVRLWSPDTSASSRARFSIENALRAALDKNEISLHYQPIVALDSGRIVGAEALMRWHSPLLGVVSPEEFIPVAEECGPIIALGDWAMRTAFTQNAEWNRRFGPRFVAVNVSGRQFSDHGFAQRATAIAAASGLPPGLCELEVTETVLMGHIGEAAAVLGELSAAGFSLALDDFGTGYSSLAYLQGLPIDKLKIDRSFVGNLHGDAGARAIAEAIVGMASALRLAVVAEGIESPMQHEALAAMHCRYGQGYLFGRPLTAEQFTALLAERASVDGAASEVAGA